MRIVVRMIGLLICRAIQGAGGRLPSRVADKVSVGSRRRIADLLLPQKMQKGPSSTHSQPHIHYMEGRRPSENMESLFVMS